MTAQDDLKFKPLQRSVVLSDPVWAAARGRAVLEHVSVSELCERLLRSYLQLKHKPKPCLPAEIKSKKRSVYLSDPVWAEGREQATLEGRSTSALLEQLLRAYLGLDSAIDRVAG